ncbi:CDP-glycerol glycerophosphotransferase family protein [Enterobacter soli]|uniref:CDP-glycerol glycerophosphotransferase family protein n=1 Tax=Enterobacter soli TaxID=885040 RepID=UPI003EDA3CA9
MISKSKKVAYILDVIFNLISSCVIKDKKTIIFMSYPDMSDNSLALYNYLLLNRTDLKLIWLVNATNEKCFRHSGSILKKWSVKGIWRFMRAATVFHTHGTYFFIRRNIKKQNIIALWHGMPLKKLGYLKGDAWPDVPYSDYSIATSGFFKEIISKTFNLKLSSVLVTGLPRNDILVDPVLICRNEIISKLPIDSCNGFIVWLPTYRTSHIKGLSGDAELRSFMEEWSYSEWDMINEKLKSIDFKIIVKLHPADILNIDNIEMRLTNVIFIKSYEWQLLNVDLYTLLAVSDGMITDVSSVLVDYALTNKPLGMTGKSMSGYTRGLNDGVKINEQVDIKNITNIKAFMEYLDECVIRKNDAHQELRFGIYHSEGTQNACKTVTEAFIATREE